MHALDQISSRALWQVEKKGKTDFHIHEPQLDKEHRQSEFGSHFCPRIFDAIIRASD